MSGYTQGLTWPRSDGSPDAWFTAEEQKPSNTQPWFELLPHSHEKYDLYETKIAVHVAKLKNIHAPSYRMPLPSGYALFAHHKPQAGGGERIDVYMKGSTKIGAYRFRSPNEFLLHAEWLLAETKDINDHSKCGCVYNKSSAAAVAKKAGSSSLGSGTPTTKRPPGDTSPKAKSAKRQKSVPDDDEEINPSAIVPERSLDMRTNRRFRKGELVWFRIDTIFPPETGKGKTLPAITHWPGLIAEATIKTKTEQPGGKPTASASLAHAWAMAGSASLQANQPQKYLYTSEYHIRPLGLFNSAEEIVKRVEDLLPWAMGNELLGGAKGWGKLGQEGTRVIREGAAAEVAEDKGKGIAPPTDEQALNKRWREKWATRWAFEDMPRNWESSVFRLGIAIKVASAITSSWTQTDKVDLVDGADINRDDYADIQAQRKTLYQGLWFGGERIWLEDLVRLKKHRAELPVDPLGLPSEGAADRAVLLRVRMITVEVSPDSTEEKNSWRCLIYGDIYELANGTPGEVTTMKIESDTGVVLQIHQPPKGLIYKRLNDATAEVTVDVMDVAGRAYPDLLDPTTQKWFKDPSLSDTANSKRVEAGDTAKALVGIKPGTIVGSKSDKWKDDLYTMVNDANAGTDKDMRNFYASLIGAKMNVSAPGTNGTNGTSVAAANANGAS